MGIISRQIIKQAAKRSGVEDIITQAPQRGFPTQAGVDIAKANPLDVVKKIDAHPSDKLVNFDTLIRYQWLAPENITNPTQVKSAITRYRSAWDENPEFKRTETTLHGQEHDIVDTPFDKETKTVSEMEGKVIVPVMGDQSRAARTINTYRGVPLEKPVNVHGGGDYPIINPEGWESMQGAAKGAQGHIDEVARMYNDDVYAVYSAMSGQATDFSVMPASVMLQFARGNKALTKASKKEFDREFNNFLIQSEKTRVKNLQDSIEAGQHTFGGKDKLGTSLSPEEIKVYRDEIKELKKKISSGKNQWVGIDHPDAVDQIYGMGNFGMEGTGAFRKQFVQFMSMKKWKDKGFATFDDEMKRTLNVPELEPVEVGDMGYTIWKAQPEADLLGAEHAKTESYNRVIRGQGLGGFESSIPPEFLMPDEMRRLAAMKTKPKTGEGKPFTKQQQVGAFRARKDVGQRITPEAVDLSETFLEVLRSIQSRYDLPMQNLRQIAKVMTDAKVNFGGRLQPNHIASLRSLTGKGIKTGALFTVLNGLLAANSEDLQAGVWGSAIKQSLKSLPKKATPQEYKKLLQKQKKLPQRFVEEIDESVLGNEVVTRQDMEQIVDDQLPKIVIAQKKSGEIDPKWMEIQGAHRMFNTGSDASINDALNMLPEAKGTPPMYPKRTQTKAIREKLIRSHDQIIKNKKYDLDRHGFENPDSKYWKENKERLEKEIAELEQYSPDQWAEKVMAEEGSLGRWLERTEKKLLKEDVLKYSPEKLREYLEADTTPEDLERIKQNWKDEAANEPMQWENMTLSGGKNYREIYFNLDLGEPKEFTAFAGDPVREKKFTNATREEVEDYVRQELSGLYNRPQDAEDKIDYHINEKKTVHKIGHMRHQPNNAAWARIDEQVGENGEKIWNIAEIQSDATKKDSYTGEYLYPDLAAKVPKNWRKDVLNSVMELAQKEGADGVAWASNPKQVDTIEKWGEVTERSGNKFVNKHTGEDIKTDRSTEQYNFTGDSIEEVSDLVNSQIKQLEKNTLKRTEEKIAGKERVLKNTKDAWIKADIEATLLGDKKRKATKKLNTVVTNAEKFGEELGLTPEQSTRKSSDDLFSPEVQAKRQEAMDLARQEFAENEGVSVEEFVKEYSDISTNSLIASEKERSLGSDLHKLKSDISREKQYLQERNRQLKSLTEFKEKVLDSGDYEMQSGTTYDIPETSEDGTDFARVIKQYTEEMPKAAKQITGKDVETIRTAPYGGNKRFSAFTTKDDLRMQFDTEGEALDYVREQVAKNPSLNEGNYDFWVFDRGEDFGVDDGAYDHRKHELNYVPLKDKETGNPTKIPSPKYASVIPAAGAAGLAATGAGYSPQAEAGAGSNLAKQLTKAAQRIGLDPNEIKVDESGYVEYPREWIDPLSQAGEGNLRYDIGRNNDAVLGRSIPEFDTRERFADQDYFHATDASETEWKDIPIDPNNPDSLTMTVPESEPTDFTEFDAETERGATFASPESDFSNRWIGQRDKARVMPLKIDEGRRFDYENPDDVEEVVGNMDYYQLSNTVSDYDRFADTDKMDVSVMEDFLKKKLAAGDWDLIENYNVQDAIKDAGFDSFNVKEWGQKNIGVYDPARIRSKYAAFDPQFAGEDHLLGQVDPKVLPATGALGLAGMTAMGEMQQEEPASDPLSQIMADEEAEKQRLIAQDRPFEQQTMLQEPAIQEQKSPLDESLNNKINPDYGLNLSDPPLIDVEQLQRDIYGMFEMGGMIGSGMLVDIASGMGGYGAVTLHSLADSLEREGAPDLAAKVRPAHTPAEIVQMGQENLPMYDPSSKSGQEYLNNIIQGINWISEHGGSEVADKYRAMKNAINREVSAVAGKEVGAAAATLPDMLLEVNPFF